MAYPFTSALPKGSAVFVPIGAAQEENATKMPNVPNGNASTPNRTIRRPCVDLVAQSLRDLGGEP